MNLYDGYTVKVFSANPKNPESLYSSQNEVEEACDAVTNVEIYAAENYSIYPNPVTDIASFSSAEITSFELYDVIGVLIFTGNNTKVDMSSLNPGI